MRIEVQRNKAKGLVVVRLFAQVDGTKERVLVASGSGDTKEIAAGWCLRNLRKMVDDARDELVLFDATEVES